MKKYLDHKFNTKHNKKKYELKSKKQLLYAPFIDIAKHVNDYLD